MTRECDNTSVGVILTNKRGELALLERGRFPIGIAPPAGHIDEHGSPEQAAAEEVFEEIGLQLAVSGLKQTAIHNRRVNNVCRRPGGDHHIWNVYEAEVTETALKPDTDETKGAGWYDPASLQILAERTKGYQQGKISENEWSSHPGLEEIWLNFLQELGYIQ